MRQSQAVQQAKEAAEKAEREAIRAQNEARLRATGVVSLFEGLRDAGVVKWSNNKPAKVEVDPMGLAVVLGFNYHRTGLEWGGVERELHDTYESSRIVAKTGERGLTINDRLVEDREGAKMEDLVTQEIVRLLGRK